jgi:hypothetical protein
MKPILILLFALISCQEATIAEDPAVDRQTREVSYQGVSVRVIIEKPAQKDLDVIIVYHGTVQFDSNLPQAATNALENFKAILDRKDMMVVSVAYPQENLLFGDGIRQAEAALLWVKHQASEELGIRVGKIFLAGHSQGGYMVTRLNTMHVTNGVISNAPGPLNLVYRCQLEETGQIPQGAVCNKLRSEYGSTTANPEAYQQRSLLNFTRSFKSDILFVQGLSDSPIQMASWTGFRQAVSSCVDCRGRLFVEIPGGQHTALFDSPMARSEFNAFINER